jgi:preprotein translocase subunit SecG
MLYIFYLLLFIFFIIIFSLCLYIKSQNDELEYLQENIRITSEKISKLKEQIASQQDLLSIDPNLQKLQEASDSFSISAEAFLLCMGLFTAICLVVIVSNGNAAADGAAASISGSFAESLDSHITHGCPDVVHEMSFNVGQIQKNVELLGSLLPPG